MKCLLLSQTEDFVVGNWVNRTVAWTYVILITISFVSISQIIGWEGRLFCSSQKIGQEDYTEEELYIYKYVVQDPSQDSWVEPA